jgi:hypothetical protein
VKATRQPFCGRPSTTGIAATWTPICVSTTAVDRTSGKPFTVPGVTIMHFSGDRVAERWDFEGSERNVS